MTLPEWVLKLARRLLALPDGRYQIVLTKNGDRNDWSVTRLGKIEQ